jgi:hypothetical protein
MARTKRRAMKGPSLNNSNNLVYLKNYEIKQYFQILIFNPLRPTVTNVSFYHFRSCNCGFVFGHDF